MREFFVYIVKCSDKTLYTGFTTDVSERIKKHNKGIGSKYTRSRLPVHLLYFEKLNNKSSALKREIEIKKLTRKQKLDLIESKCQSQLPVMPVNFDVEK